MEPSRQRRLPVRPPSRRRLLPGAALLLLAAVAVWASLPAAEAWQVVPESPPKAPPGPAASLPALQPLPAALAARMAELTRETARWRGLDFRRQVTSGELGTQELRRWLEATLAEELPPARLAGLEAALEAFGFIRPELDLGRFLPDLLTEQIGGFYDTEREVLVLVRNAAARAAGGDAAAGDGASDSTESLAGKVEEAVLVHELTHALQDQVFALPESNDPAFLFDRESARDALVEGDATLTMFDYMMGVRLEEQPGLGAILGGLGEMAGGAGLAGGPGTEELAAAPPYFREMLLFSYFQGLDFCLQVRRAGGQRLLDYAFAQDPPRSTEQILHPEKWHGRRDDPVAIALPDLAGGLPGWTRLAEGELGEMGIGILLRGDPAARPARRAAGTAAAAGWGGDRFAAYGKGDRRLLLWVTEWDAAAEADEFAAAARRLGDGWTVARQSPSRVSLVRGELPVATKKAVLARLAAVPTAPPAGRDIDFKALGIERRPALDAPPAPRAPPGGDGRQ